MQFEYCVVRMNRYTSIIVQTESNVKFACILPLRNRKSRLDA